MSNDEIDTVISDMDERFTSGNNVPVGRARIDYKEWQVICDALDATRRERDEARAELNQLAEAIKREATDLLNADPAKEWRR
jgi:hypothetical protein